MCLLLMVYTLMFAILELWLIRAALHSRCRHYILQLWFLSFFFFFLAYSQHLQTGCALVRI